MQVLDDIWASVKGNSKARYKDPLIGTFIVSWCFCNWDKLVVLIWGTKKLDERVHELALSMSLTTDLSLFYKDLDLIIFPVLITIGYLFLLPWISLWVKVKQNNAVVSQYTHTLDFDLKQAQQQRELNKERLRSNPEKEFLAKDVEIDIEAAQYRLERRNKIQEYIDKKTETASAISYKAILDAKTSESIANQEKLNLEQKEKQAIKEKQRFAEQSVIHNATMASHRFPVAYYFIDILSKSLKNDNIVLSLSGLSSCIAAIFGYQDFDELINDKEFNNDNLKYLKYILIDDDLAKKLDSICNSEKSENKDIQSDLIFDHIYDLFDDLPYDFLSKKELFDKVKVVLHEGVDDILQSALYDTFAEECIMYEGVDFDSESFGFGNDFYATFIAHIISSHAIDTSCKGKDMSVEINFVCSPIFGQFGLMQEDVSDIFRVK